MSQIQQTGLKQYGEVRILAFSNILFIPIFGFPNID